jgi:hypothetical protein
MAKKTDVDIVTEEKVRNGGILVRMYFDVQDKDRDRLQPLLVDLINNRLLKERGVVYCYGKINDPIQKNGMFITSAVITALFEGIGPLVNVVFNFAPAGIELLKPEKELRIGAPELQSVLLDLSGISVTYSRYMLEKILSPKEVEDLKRQLENRVELGKRIVKESKDKENKAD